MPTKRVLAIHDICSFGRCSLTAAIPVISAQGIQVCPFPTAIFSNNLTYGKFTFADCTSHMTAFMDQWQQLGFSFDAIYSGFLGDAKQIAIVSDTITRFAKEDTLIVVDPAMADDGALYPVFTPDIIPEMRKLTSKATVITPNYTEALFLLDRAYDVDILQKEQLETICKQLAALGPKQVVITSVPASEEEIKVACYDSLLGIYDECIAYRIPFHTCGTGDVFTSVLTGALVNGENLHKAVIKATKFLSDVIMYTYKSGSDYHEGVQLEPCLGKLLQ